MAGARRHKRILGWLAIIALLSNVLASPSLVPSMAASFVDDVLGQLVICTADGAKTTPGHGGSGGHAPANHCPACVTVAQFVLAVAIILTAIAFALSPAARPTRLQLPSPAVHVSLGGVRSRAPPLFA
jgi:amino acid transporter